MAIKLMAVKLKYTLLMKFYDREKELQILRRNWEKSEQKSFFTVMMG